MRSRRLCPGLTAAGLATALALAPAAAGADEPGFLGRLFRMGGGGSNATRARADKPASPFGDRSGPAAGHDHAHDHGQSQPPPRQAAGDEFVPPVAALPPGGGPSTPEVPDAAAVSTPIAPRARTSAAATEAEPLLSRVALGRSNDGGRFGMFMQVYAEGVHRLSPTDVKPLADLIAAGDLGRNRGHCGAPSGDYLDEVHVVVFERRLGRLTAQSFSYSGNPQGCDPSVGRLHAVVEALQLRLSGQPAAAVAAVDAGAPAPGPAPSLAPGELSAPVSEAADAPAGPVFSSSRAAAPTATVGAGRVLPPLPAAAPPTGPVIPLSPVDPR